MEKHGKRIPQVIPFDDWQKHGTWRDTLREELRVLPPNVLTMCIISMSNRLFLKYPFVFGIHMHERGRQWQALEKIVGYEYCWESLDGHALDELNIRGPFNQEVLINIIEAFENFGLELHYRWDLQIAFG